MFRANKMILLASVVSAGVFTGSIAATGAQPPVSLEGTWSGNGQVHLPSGASEAARCRASFRRAGGNTFHMNAVCATQSARVVQTASLERVSANRFVGDFHNAEYNVSGHITISIKGSGLSASLSGGGGSAHFHLSR